jgi:ABC-type spermidine/putrescine transport systems, ATPase components
MSETGSGRRLDGAREPEASALPTPEGEHSEPGVVRDVVYVGMVTRYIVDLERGGELVVVQQNLETSSQQALEAQGRQVRLSWRPEHTYVIKEGDN